MITNRGNIRALDLRRMKELWVLSSLPEYGEITAALYNRKSRWILTGTSRGVLCLWDTRFRVKLRVWLHPSGGPISKIAAHYRESSKLVAISSLNEVSLWDISKVDCLQVWCSVRGSAKEGPPEDILRRSYPSGFKVWIWPMDYDKHVRLTINRRLHFNIIRSFGYWRWILSQSLLKSSRSIQIFRLWSFPIGIGDYSYGIF